MFFTHLTVGSFRENISHAEQGWANPGRINELEVPEPSGGSAQGPALPCSPQPALFSSSRLIYAHRQDRTGRLLCFPEDYRALKEPAALGGCWSSREDEEARPGASAARHGTEPQWMCRGKGAQPGTAKPSSREISPKRADNMRKKGFYSEAGEFWVGEAALVLSLSPLIAPQSLIALGKPQGKEWEGEAETDAKNRQEIPRSKSRWGFSCQRYLRSYFSPAGTNLFCGPTSTCTVATGQNFSTGRVTHSQGKAWIMGYWGGHP